MVASPSPLLVVLLGPTASGKTSLSLHLARQFDGEIVSCDSVAVYRGLEIGSAKPSSLERQLVPHHLIDVASIEDIYSAGDYARAARAAIAGIAARSRLPIVTGGSGLYLRALLQGLFPGPKRSEPLRERLRHKAQELGAKHLHRVLGRLDPASAERIHENDIPKVIRAIEISLAGAEPMSQAWQKRRESLEGYRILRLGLAPERQELYARINQRAARMFEEGLVDETRALMARESSDPPRASSGDAVPPALGSLGYRQAVEYLRGALSLEQAIAAASQGHRNYAKRQLTWFRREPEVTWLSGFGDTPAIANEAEALVRAAL